MPDPLNRVRHYLRRSLATALVLGCVLAVSARAQTATVATDDPVYVDLDHLIASGLVDTVVVGQRPYSWAQIGRIVGEARRRIDANTGATMASSLRMSIDRLSQRLGNGVPPRFTYSVTGSALLTDSELRAVPDNGLGPSEADINPLTARRQGRRFATGGNAALESSIALDVTENFSLQARPRLWFAAPRGAGNEVTAELLAASARMRYKNAALTIGREYTEWSLATGGGLFFSHSAPALDMIRLASDRPFGLPWLLRYLGPVGATIQLADLGPSVSNSNSRMVSYKVSALPHRLVELGASFANHFGGSGARNPTAANRIFDLLPFIDIFRTHNDATDFDSDKLLGVDGRLRIPAAGNITVFGEVALEDFDHKRLGSVFTEDAAYTAGVIIPQLLTPALSTELRFHTLGIRFYQHHLVRNGIASRRVLLGDDLSRDGDGLAGLVRWRPSNALMVTVQGDLEERRNDRYLGRYVNPDSTGLEFRRVSSAPREGRRRGVIGAQWQPMSSRLSLEVHAGVERTSNFGFVDGRATTRGLGSFALTAFQ